MTTVPRLTRNEYYAEIVKHCVKNDTKYFSSKWFYETFPEVDHNMLHNFTRDNLLKTESANSRTFYVTQYYSNLRYIGLCVAAYVKNNPRTVKPEVAECVRKTWLSPDLNEFLILTYDMTSKEKSGILDMTLKEVQILEDYFYLRLAINIIKDEVELPVGHEETNFDLQEDTDTVD